MSMRYIACGLILLSLMMSLSCDPCRQLAYALCECVEKATDRKLCEEKVKLWESQASYEQAVSAERCTQILDNTKCTCERFNQGYVEDCGFSRNE